MKSSNIHQALISHNFMVDELFGIWRQMPLSEFAYNDGDDAENYILETVKQASDVTVNSVDLMRKIKDWPSLYHLSSSRANLLRPFEDWFQGKKVLEIGCGCGAISRFLGESGAEVVSVEGSYRRAGIARQRCRGLPNVDVICASSDLIPDLGQFDAVLLIGVLEYARKFLGDDGQQVLLAACRQRLAPEGRLFVAIENKLGIKYFAGANEDHVNLPMYGINNSYQKNDVITFGKKELTDLLNATGFDHTEYYLPLPDYKLPATVVTPKGWQNFSKDLAELAVENVHKEQQKIAEHIFSLEQGTSNIWHNDLSADLANSFLVIAGVKCLPSLTPSIAAFHYSEGRIPKYCKSTIFTILDNGQLEVNSERTNKNTACAETIHHIETNDEFYRGKTLWFDLVDIVNRPDWQLQEIGEWAREWMNYLFSLLNSPINYDKNFLLPENFLDALPFNIIKNDNGEFADFDHEWNANENITSGFICFRGIFHSLLRLTSVADSGYYEENNLAKLSLDIMNNIGFLCEWEDIESYFFQELRFITLIQERDSNDSYAFLKEVKLVKRAKSLEQLRLQAKLLPVKNQEISVLQQQIINQEEQITKQKEQIIKQEEQILTQNEQIITQKEQIITQEELLANQIEQMTNFMKNDEQRARHILEQENVIADQYRHIQSLVNSISWKLSAPIRMLSHWLPAKVNQLLNALFNRIFK